MDCRQVKFRSPVPDYLAMSSTRHQWHDRSISKDIISDGDAIPRQSHCSIELDVCVQHIANRNEIQPRYIHHDFVERFLVDRPEEKLVHSMAGLWRDETRRRKARMGFHGSESSPFPPEVLVSVSADPRNSQPGGWIHEEEFREKIQGLIQDERGKRNAQSLDFDKFVEQQPLEEQLMTSLDSVEDFFPEKISRSGRPYALSSNLMKEIQNPQPEVDEGRVLSFRDDDFPYESDEELAMDLEMTQKAREKLGERSRDESAGCNTAPPFPQDVRNGGDSAADTLAVSYQGPTSAEELKSLGIRDVGDYEALQNDLFEVPQEFSSSVVQPKMSLKNEKSEPPRKRPRFSPEDPAKMSRFVSHDCNADLAMESRSHKPLQDVARIPIENGLDTTIPSLNGVTGHQQKKSRLSFSIVKDLQDPYTIAKLSQGSTSTSKGSQKAKDQENGNSKSEYVRSTPSAPSSLNSGSSKTWSSAIEMHQCAAKMYSAFQMPREAHILCFSKAPPAFKDVQFDLHTSGCATEIHQDAYYSNEQDVPERGRDYAGKEFKLESLTVPYLPDFDASGTSAASMGQKPNTVVERGAQQRLQNQRRRGCSLVAWEIAEPPPTSVEVQEWLDQETSLSANQKKADKDPLRDADNEINEDTFEIAAATQKNKHGFKYSQKQKSNSVKHETQYMSIMSLEVHVNTRGKLLPNPEIDEINCVFWCIQSDEEEASAHNVRDGMCTGIVALSEEAGLAYKVAHLSDVDVDEEPSELDLINRLVDIVRGHDPDILTGYEVHGSSWGYIIERARCKYDYNLCDEFSRMMSQSHGRFGKEDDRWGFNHTSTIRVTGRHVINVWRAMRGELNLLQYTMENVAFHVCHKRVPHYSFQDLTMWYNSRSPKDVARVIHYYLGRVKMDLEILEKNELIPRTSEQARLLGVDFFSVFSRGSQFKVESLMFRIAKPENFLLPSPSRKQVGQQNALECLPLVMEPQSAFYNSPLLVLDFQSLYPSVMIAYNYCYSTFLGRVVSWRGQNKMGFTDYHRTPGLLELLRDYINIAPNGIMYAKPEIRKSLLAKMLGEILETRVMVKSGMKVDREDKTLQRLLNNRQLALKLIANVTYGYTSASFSGRMPCSEIADSIVQTARETLEKAIALIHAVARWDAEVVYGDTDSLFVYLKGRTKDQAFDIGKEIAKAITDMNPRPVKLKFEKVYLPCVLLAKKRYVGFKYESKTQQVPEFDAKGIETVRRDGTPAEQKIEENALKILFRTADLSQVKEFFQQQCTKIMHGRISIQDFCFAREVKLSTYSDKGPPPPGALISMRKMLEDPRAEPQYGERVPYVVVTGAPGARLIDRCVAPDILLTNDDNELDAEYYISKNLIPPLERIFNLVGANVRQWYDEMPKFQRMRRVDTSFSATEKDVTGSKKTMEAYMRASSCAVCRQKLEGAVAICGRCTNNVDTSTMILKSRLSAIERKRANLERVCRSCAGLGWTDEVKCDSKDCPVFYTRMRHSAVSRSKISILQPTIELISGLTQQNLEW